jgi:hypothetical protein
MTATASPQAAPPSPPASPEDEAGGWHWLDTAGIAAGLLLVVIVADVWTDGRVLSRPLRRLFKRDAREGGEPDASPPEQAG